MVESDTKDHDRPIFGTAVSGVQWSPTLLPPTFPKVTWNPGNHQIWGFWGSSGAARWAHGVRKSSQIVLRTKKWFGSFLEPNFVQILCKINEIRSKSLSEARLGRFEQIGPKSNFWTSRRDFSARWWRLQNPSGRHLIPIPKMTFLDFFAIRQFFPTFHAQNEMRSGTQKWHLNLGSQPGARILTWIDHVTSRRDFSALWQRLQNLSGRHLICIPKMPLLDFFEQPNIFSNFPCTKWNQVCDPEVPSQYWISTWNPDFDLDRPCHFEARFLNSVVAIAKSVW